MSTFTIDGVEYPTLEDDVTLDEAGWFYRIAGVGVEALGDDEVGDQMSKVKALICLSIARVKPELTHAEIEQRIGKIKITELENVFTDVAEQSPPSVSASDDPPASSGDPSSGASDAYPDEAGPALTGTPPSATTSPSDHRTSADLRRVS